MACLVCGESLEGRSARAKFCSDRCRKRKQRGADVSPMVTSPDRGSSGPGVLSGALAAEFEAAGVPGSPRAIQAVLLAQRLDMAPISADTGSAIASLSKEVDRLRVAALKDAAPVGDPLDELTKKRREKRVRAG